MLPSMYKRSVQPILDPLRTIHSTVSVGIIRVHESVYMCASVLVVLVMESVRWALTEHVSLSSSVSKGASNERISSTSSFGSDGACIENSLLVVVAAAAAAVVVAKVSLTGETIQQQQPNTTRPNANRMGDNDVVGKQDTTNQEWEEGN